MIVNDKTHEKIININAISSIDVYHLKILDVYPKHIIKKWALFSKQKNIIKYVYKGNQYNNVQELLDSIYHPILGCSLKFDNFKNIFYFPPVIRIGFVDKSSIIKTFNNEEELMLFYNKLINDNTKVNFIKIN